MYEIAKVQNPYANIADTASKIILYSVENRDNLIYKAMYYNVDELICTFFNDLKPQTLHLKQTVAWEIQSEDCRNSILMRHITLKPYYMIKTLCQHTLELI